MVTSPSSPLPGNSADDTPIPVWMALRPRDAIQVRDGRTFTAGAGGAARTQRPWPSTVAGALGAAFKAAAGPGTGQAPMPQTVRGPFLGRWESGTARWHLSFPVPADLVPSDLPGSDWLRLLPQDTPALTDLDWDGVRWLHAPEAGTRDEDLWWDGPELRRYLHCEDIDSELQSGLDPVDPPLQSERRKGIALQNRTVRQGHLYESDYLRLRESAQEEWAFLALCELDPDLSPPPPGPVRLGGGGRLADLQVCEGQKGLVLPEPPEHFPDGKVLVYLATPAIWRCASPDGSWRNTWLPPLPKEARLVAAAVNGPEHVASAGRETKEGDEKEYAWLRWAVPAGSVYLLRFTGADPQSAAAEWAHRVHGRALGETNDSDHTGKRLATAGFGLILTGTWT
ncbi:CRISPR-associated protein, Cmr3 family [Marinactinospora thermotolerans DSM 45154]|uniref:CRISPR-associated protein, Cmr3 family n=1 Tax=Marinactinospora thermotolerans DSM 45154 TaxID=1122192 RepID=A0A1T4S4Y8_9ACTN|nr:type III-B CRISPR module-associated Cmr3 family protein [Marinactinospora thermotolerans]SKA23207.1 CRISPR-associated protein, Cmr3 family [Marinactinospora thermotolerans DSM 45154]